MSAQQKEFMQSIMAATDPDNMVRKQAEEFIETFQKTEPVTFFTALIDNFCHYNDSPQGVMMCGILAKNTLSKAESFERIGSRMPPEELDTIHRNLLMRLADTNLSKATRKITGTVIILVATKFSAVKREHDRQQQQAQQAQQAFGQAAPSLTTSWPDLWPQLVSVASNDSMMHDLRRSCLVIYSECTPSLLHCSDFRETLPQLQDLLSAILHEAPAHSQDSNHNDLVCSAVAAVAHILEGSSLHQQLLNRQQFDPILAPAAVSAFNICCNRDDVEHSFVLEFVESIAKMVKETDDDAAFFVETHSIGDLFTTLFSVAQKHIDYDETAVTEAICDLILDIVETNKALILKSIKDGARKLFDFFADLIVRGLDGFDEESWGIEPPPNENPTEAEYDQGLELFHIGATSLDRLAEIVRGKQIDTLVAPFIQTSFASGDWKKIAASLCLLTYVFEGVRKQLKPFLDDLMSQVVGPSLMNEHRFVRHQALLCIAQLATDDCPHFQKTYFPHLIPVVARMMHQSHDCPRNEAAAGVAFSAAFNALDEHVGESIEGDDEEENRAVVLKHTRFVEPYFPQLIDAILESMKHHDDESRKPSFVIHAQIRALNDIIEVTNKRVQAFAKPIIEFLQAAVAKYYDRFQQVVSAAAGDSSFRVSRRMKEDIEFRYDMLCLNVAIEGATLTFSYLENEESTRPTAVELTRFLVHLLESNQLKVTDETLKFVLRGLTCMSEHLQSDIVPVLDRVIPPLLHVANLDCDYKIEDVPFGQPFNQSDEDEDEYDEEYGKIERVPIQHSTNPGQYQIVKIPTDLINVKDLAATILFSMCELLQGLMFEGAPQLVECALRLLNFRANSEVREDGAVMITAVISKVLTNQKRPFDRSLSEETLHQARSQVAATVLPRLVAAMEDEHELGVMAKESDALGELIVILPQEFLAEHSASGLSQKLFDIIGANQQSALDTVEEHRDEAQEHIDEENDEEDVFEEFRAEAEKCDEVVCNTLTTVGNILVRSPVFVKLFFKHDLSRCIFNDVLPKCQAVVQLHAEIMKKHKGSASKKGGNKKKGFAKSAAQQQQQQQSAGVSSLKFHRVDCTYAFSIVGTIFSKSDTKALFEEPLCMAVIKKSTAPLIASLPHIDDAEIAQAAVWSFGAIIKFHADTKKAGLLVQKSTTAEEDHEKDSNLKLNATTADFFVTSSLGLLQSLLTSPPYDQEDEEFNPVIANTVSAFVHALDYFTNEDFASNAEVCAQCVEITEKIFDFLPLEGDDEESNDEVYPRLVRMMQDEDHCIFGKKAGPHHEALAETFKNMLEPSQVEESSLTVANQERIRAALASI